MSDTSKYTTTTKVVLTHGRVLAVIFFLLPTTIAFAPVQTSAFLMVASVATLGTWLWTERRAPPVNRRLTLGVALLVFFGAISAFWAIEPISALTLALRLALLSAAGIILCGVVGALDAVQRRTIGSAALLGTALALSLLYVDLLGSGLIQTGLLSEQHADYGRTVSLVVLIGWSLLVQAPISSRPVLGVGFAILVAGVLVQTPGFADKVAWLVRLVTLFAAWRFRAAFSKLVFAMIAVAFLLGPTIARKLDQPDYYKPLIAAESEFAPMRWTVAIAHRLHMWGYAATKTLEHPILGWGLDATRRIPGGGIPIEPKDLGFARPDLSMNAATWLGRGTAVHLSLHPHNAALQIWLELGLAGTLLAAGFVFYLVNAAVHHRHPAGLALCLSAMVVANFSYGIWQNWWLAGLWLVSALYLVGVEPDDAGITEQATEQTVS